MRTQTHDHHPDHNLLLRLHKLTRLLKAETLKLYEVVPDKRRRRHKKECEEPMASIDTTVAALTAAVNDSIAAQEALLVAGAVNPATAQAVVDATALLTAETAKVKAGTPTP
jgi:hypothetical protein